MKRTALIIGVLMCTGMVSASTGYSGPANQPHIMDGSDRKSGLEGSGTNWSSNIQASGTTSNLSKAGKLREINFSERSVSFKGFLDVSTPCGELKQKTERLGESDYRIILTTFKNSSGGCTQQKAVKKYNASFTGQTPFRLEVLHGNKTVETLTHPDYRTKPTPPPQPPKQEKGIIESVIDWFENLLSDDKKVKTVETDSLDNIQVREGGTSGKVVIERE